MPSDTLERIFPSAYSLAAPFAAMFIMALFRFLKL